MEGEPTDEGRNCCIVLFGGRYWCVACTSRDAIYSNLGSPWESVLNLHVYPRRVRVLRSHTTDCQC